MKNVINVILVMFALVACTKRGEVAVAPQHCTVEGMVITCPDGSTLTVPNGASGANGQDGEDGTDGAAGTPGSTITVTLYSFPLVTTCLQLNASTWAKRSGGTDIKLYALATCTGASSQDMTHTGNEIFWSGARQFYVMDTLTTMQRIDF